MAIKETAEERKLRLEREKEEKRLRSEQLKKGREQVRQVEEPAPLPTDFKLTPEQQAAKDKAEAAKTEATFQEELAQRDPSQTKIITGEGGRPRGFTKDGETFLGLPPSEVLAETQPEQIAAGAVTGQQAAAQAQQQAALQQQIEQIGQIGQLSGAEEAAINFSQAATAGAAGSIPSILGGVAGGALLGGKLGIPGGVAGVALGAGVGALGGFISGMLGNIKEQQRGELQAADVELTNARTNMRQLAMLASRDPANADVYIKAYNDQLTRVYQARKQTKVEVQGDLNSFMEDGREQLADFDSYLQAGGIADIYGQKLTVALQTGALLSVSGDELLTEAEAEAELVG